MRVSERIRDAGLLVASWLFAVSYSVTNVFPDPDLWGRLAMGALIFQNGRFPYHDIFSYTAPHARWVDHEWLTGVVFYQILSHFGEFGFMIFKYLMILGMFALLFRLHRKVYRMSALYAFYALFLLIDVCCVGLYATVRSHIFTFLFFLIELYLLEQVRLGQKNKHFLWFLLPIAVLWGNLHGGFAMGLLLMACYGLGEVLQQRKWQAGLFHGAVAACMFLAVGLLNPYGLSYGSFLFHAWTLDRSRIGEWSALRFNSWLFLPVQLCALFGLSVPLLRWAFRDKQDSTEAPRLLTPTLVLFWVILMMLRAVRLQPFVAFTMVAYLPLFLNPAFVRRIAPQSIKHFFQRQASAFCNTLPALALSLAIGMVSFEQVKIGLDKVVLTDELTISNLMVPHYPVGAIQYLRQSSYHGNLMVQFDLGEFALWTLYPRFKVSMDGRYEEVYSQDLFLQNYYRFNKYNFVENQASFNGINQSVADFLLMEAALPVSSMLANSPLWKVVYLDPEFVVFARKTCLSRFPKYPMGWSNLSRKSISIGDLFTDADLKRFKTSEY